jgi:hypothetical protein
VGVEEHQGGNVGRAIVRSADELTNRIEEAVARLQRMPEVIRAFFADKDLRYITTPVSELLSSNSVSP